MDRDFQQMKSPDLDVKGRTRPVSVSKEMHFVQSGSLVQFKKYEAYEVARRIHAYLGV
jgi:hypothetical protein